jgi:hypothetical protein
VQAETLEREVARRAVRVEPLGRDRDGAEYVVFPGDARVFVRRGDVWGCYATGDEVAALRASLSEKGVRERALRQALDALPPLPTQAALAAAVPAMRFSPIATRRSSRVRTSVDGKQEPVPYLNTYAKH